MSTMDQMFNEMLSIEPKQPSKALVVAIDVTAATASFTIGFGLSYAAGVCFALGGWYIPIGMVGIFFGFLSFCAFWRYVFAAFGNAFA